MLTKEVNMLCDVSDSQIIILRDEYRGWKKKVAELEAENKAALEYQLSLSKTVTELSNELAEAKAARDGWKNYYNNLHARCERLVEAAIEVDEWLICKPGSSPQMDKLRAALEPFKGEKNER